MALKVKFEAILDHYLVQRETLNPIIQGRLIKELQDNIRSQLKQL